MKRGEPLKRTTPMPRGKGLQRGDGWSGQGSGGLRRNWKPQAPRKALPARSAKRAREYAQPGGRRDLVAATLKAEPRCQAQWACRGAPSVDVHERLSRARGGSILDPVQGHHLAVCRACHSFIGNEPRRATELGLVLPSWHKCGPSIPCSVPVSSLPELARVAATGSSTWRGASDVLTASSGRPPTGPSLRASSSGTGAM